MDGLQRELEGMSLSLTVFQLKMKIKNSTHSHAVVTGNVMEGEKREK